MKKNRHYVGVVIASLFLALCLSPQVRTVLSMPEKQKIIVGEGNSINIKLPQGLQEKIDIKITGSSRSIFTLGKDPTIIINRTGSTYKITALKPGKTEVSLNILEYMPIKSIQIEALPTKRVVVGGHSIGVMLQSRGIMVVGFAPVLNSKGGKSYPGREEGVEIGDRIFKIDGQAVNSENDLARIIDSKKDQELKVSLNRRGKNIIVPVKPLLCPETNRYRIGLYVRDGVVGLGTLTFWDPSTRQFAALGHVIVDADTKQDIDVLKGRVVSASIQTVKPGKPGRPGEKIGVFDEQGGISGKIMKNTNFGIYGRSDNIITNAKEEYTMEVAYAHQVHPGKAQMLTVVNGSDIEKWDIRIEKVYPHRENGKGMVIRVTDPRLLSLSGGIVQGMSGSPIIQGNKIVGAVTHVFLNDPTSGYGTFMDNMLSEMPADL
ncbi:Peptidase S55, sporulation stage IV, protein B [Syntrophomonas zehnderi OL-4]|uniref:Peptidase S55, sporulation stage IV, protein B n=1 Tax=Syntrophomonas zehnderi OL-4 TaxID=690567 RepID=A0A0E4C8K4_9FIRM|nr:SpoIVB peptidase [Syntrophomonas zehnderi]CFX50276.1 Peptidase S55, sporulation stage IV, protein B [Syntrophomonas zehnderi OL-4]